MPILHSQTVLFDTLPVDGRHGTFEGVKFEPVHSWYHYLEGYAPAFVEQLRKRFLPDARRILDPFAGTGTTPLTLAEVGVECGYCELNPAMRFVIKAKTDAVLLGASKRVLLAHRLQGLANDLPSLVARADEDEALRANYSLCFGTSEFFNSDSLSSVLRLRSIADAVGTDEPLVRDLLSLAAISNIVLCSQLKRAGDVRFKTPLELAKGTPEIVASSAHSLRRMAKDLAIAPIGKATASLLAADAKDLLGAPLFEAEGVITSPPYLNGTNYIRNTKLELWFLRLITSSADLRVLRDGVVTSGINDVTMLTSNTGVIPAVERIVQQIKAAEYDQRIHRMVAGYFRDMHSVFAGLWSQLVPGAVVCMDIGDSRYAGVNIPTQELLTEIARDVGFEFLEQVPLRARRSKDKSMLTQDVLVFRRGVEQSRRLLERADQRNRRWQWFRQSVPHQRPPFTKRNWGHPLHSACSYNGKMKPSLAHFLVHCFTKAGDRVLDPFSGAGTIPFEAALQGRRPIGIDISLMAQAVTNAKINPPNPNRLDAFVGRLEAFLAEHKPSKADLANVEKIRFNRSIPEYFHQDTLREVLVARSFFQEVRDDSPEWAFALTAMLHILHGNRPYALSRRSHPVTPFAPTGPAEYRGVVGRLREKIDRGLETTLPPEFIAGECCLADICGEWPTPCKNIDAIITSPPFFDSTRFYMTNWMRYWFCGWERPDFDAEPARFIESLQRQSLGVYRTVFERFRQNLVPGGVAVLHLGRSRKCDMGAELSRIAAEYLAVEEVFTEDVSHCEKHGLSDKGTVTAHQYLVLSKR